MKSYQAKTGSIEQKWYIVDAEDKILGRLASQLVRVLMGKNKPEYTPNIECGDYIIVINAEKIKVTGKKAQYSKYVRFSGYPSGLHVTSFETMLAKKPTEILRLAVKRMLPKNILARQTIKRLKIYAAPEHPHASQKVDPFPYDKI